VRVRYEDGREISRQTESETVVRPPKDRVMGYGTKVVVRTTTVDGVKIEYWRAVNLYATSYSPCRSGADRCYTGTASGLPVKKGVVAVIRSWFNMMSGQQVYIPGYGSAVIADIGGGISGKPWIDLGWSDDDYQPMTGWVTVYFLTPVPPSILYNLQ
jgi:3D (Asp-Asp-Asp) domain-containing protein